MRRTVVAVVAALLVVAGACSSGDGGGDGEAEGGLGGGFVEDTTTTTDAGGGPATTAAPDAADEGPPPTTGTLRILVVDEKDRPVAAAPVAVTGPRAGSVTTGADGRATWDGPVGGYRLALEAGCFGTVEARGAGGAATTVAGGTVEVTLKTDTRNRVAPDPSRSSYRRVEPPPPPPTDESSEWKPSEVYGVTFLLRERCNNRPAANASTTGLQLRPVNGLDVVGALPATTDAQGFVTARVRCRPGTDGWGLVVFHLDDPSVEVDVFPGQKQGEALAYCGE